MIDMAMLDANETAGGLVPADRHVSRQVGCSDLGALFVAFDVRDGLPPNIQKWIGVARERAAWGKKKSPPEEIRCVATWAALRARKVATPSGSLPEIIATKAGLREREAQAGYAKTGEKLERLLLSTWRATLPEAGELDAASIRTQHEVRDLYPAEWLDALRMPSIRCAKVPALVTYGPDAWARTSFGEPVVINAKCSRDWKEEPDPTAWLQMQGESMCALDALAVLVVGQKWLADYMREPVEERPIRVWPIEPHAGTQQAIAEVCRRTMAAIDEADAKFREATKEAA